MNDTEGYYLSREKLEELILLTEKAKKCYDLSEMKEEINTALIIMYGIRHDSNNFRYKNGCG